MRYEGLKGILLPEEDYAIIVEWLRMRERPFAAALEIGHERWQKDFSERLKKECEEIIPIWGFKAIVEEAEKGYISINYDPNREPGREWRIFTKRDIGYASELYMAIWQYFVTNEHERRYQAVLDAAEEEGNVS